MLELGKRGSAGGGKKSMPVLSDGAVVTTLHLSREGATAAIDGHTWVFGAGPEGPFGRRAEDPETVVRLSARRRRSKTGKWWTGASQFDLEGRTLLVDRSPRPGRPQNEWVLDGQVIVADSGRRLAVFPRPTLTGALELPLHQRVFVLWALWAWSFEATY